jgi:hypothetical protein
MGSILSVEQIRGLSSGDTPNTIVIPSGQTLSITDGVQSSDMPSGSVIQQVHFTNAVDTTVSQESGWVTVLTGTFTPKKVNSKVYIEVDLAHGVRASGEHQFGHRIYSSNSGNSNHALTSNNSDLYDVMRVTVASGGGHLHTRYLGYELLNMDSIGSITYNFQIAQPNSTYPDIRINFAARAISVMTIKEVAV